MNASFEIELKIFPPATHGLVPIEVACINTPGPSNLSPAIHQRNTLFRLRNILGFVPAAIFRFPR